MKICHVITSLDVGGAELVLYRLLLAQPEMKDDVTIVSLTRIGTLGTQLQQAGFTVLSLNVTGGFSLLFAIFKLAMVFKKVKPDIIQSWLYHADFIASISSILVKKPRVFWGIHTCLLPQGKLITHFIMKCCAMMSSRIPEHIICVAEASRKLHIANGYNAARMTVIPNGFNMTDYQSTPELRRLSREKLGFVQGMVHVGIIGRWHPDKGQDIMLNAIKLLQHHFPDVVFVFVGRGCDRDNVEFLALIKNCPLPDNVLTLGERSDIPDILRALDLFCLPSRTEAFPLALGEAMCAGLPVVATDVGDVRYMVGDLVPVASAGDVEHLASIMTDMLTQSEPVRLAIGDKLRERAVTLFSIESMVSRYQQLYENRFF